MYNKLIKIALLAVAIGALSNPIAASANDTDGNRQETIGFAIEEMVCAPASEVWDAVFTPQGMKQLGMAQSSIDYRVGGMLMRRVGEGGETWRRPDDCHTHYQHRLWPDDFSGPGHDAENLWQIFS